jgi:hypothetical protein
MPKTGHASELRRDGHPYPPRKCTPRARRGSDGVHWIVGARVGQRRALVFPSNGETDALAERDAATKLFIAIEGLDQ